MTRIKILCILAAVLLVAAVGTGLFLYGNQPTQITVLTAPDKTSFGHGSTLDTTGLTLELTRRNGSTQVITEGFTCTPMELTEVGTIDISVTLDDLTASFPVESVPVITEVRPLNPPDKTLYFTGETYDLTGLTLEVLYSDGSSHTADSGFTLVGGPDMTTAGTYAIILEYEGIETIVPIEILPTFEFENLHCMYASISDESGAGLNQAGENVLWATVLAFDMDHDLFHAFPPSVNCSWTDTIGECVQLSTCYSAAREGETAVEIFFCPAGQSYSGNNQAIMYLYLPDDPSLDGFQSITVNVGPYSRTIKIELEYLGDYETGTGWNIWEA